MESLSRLLVALDPDAERAAGRYQSLRARLIEFFQWRGSMRPEEHADETLDRMTRRLSDGEPIANPEAYARGIARLILMEARRDARRWLWLDDSAETTMREHQQTMFDPHACDDDVVETELRLHKLDCCLRQLSLEERHLILEYYAGADDEHIDVRRRLSERLQQPTHVIRARVFRIRSKLQRAMRKLGSLDEE